MFEKGIKPFLVSRGVMAGGGPKLNPPVSAADVVIRFLICAACSFSLPLCAKTNDLQGKGTRWVLMLVLEVELKGSWTNAERLAAVPL